MKAHTMTCVFGKKKVRLPKNFGNMKGEKKVPQVRMVKAFALFKGNKIYPEDGDFHSFIAKRRGSLKYWRGEDDEKIVPITITFTPPNKKKV